MMNCEDSFDILKNNNQIIIIELFAFLYRIIAKQRPALAKSYAKKSF